MSRYVDADFRHHLYGKGIETMFFDTAAISFDQVTTKLAAEPLCHLASARISGAEKQDF